MVTFNRFDSLIASLQSLFAQSRAPDAVVVVDNASPDGSGARLDGTFETVIVVSLSENLGVGAGLAAGMEVAMSTLPDVLWLVEDDTTYAESYLDRALGRLADDPSVSLVGSRGWRWDRGLWAGVPVGVESRGALVTLDGMVIRSDVVRVAGFPMREYFMMIQDVEYPLRLSRHGFVGVVWPELQSECHVLGASAGGGAAVYRSYYQVRNHLRMVIGLRSPVACVGFLRRFGGLVVSDLRSDNAVPRLRMRVAGLCDGVRGRMGVTVAPGATLPSRPWRG